MSATIEVKGLADLEAKLVLLGEVAGMRILRSAAKKAFEPVVEEAKRRVPMGAEGAPHLRDSLGLVVKKAGYMGGDVVATVGLAVRKLPVKVRRMIKRLNRRRKAAGLAAVHFKNPRRYWHLIEFGTRRTRATSFARVAFDMHVDHALAILQVVLREKIARAMKRRGIA